MTKINGSYDHDYTINYSDVGEKLTLKPSHAVKYFQDIAIRHSTVIGYDLNWFKDSQQGWVLLYWHIRISKLPKEADKVTISTWTEPYKRAQANRDFLLKDTEGRELCYGSSRWVLIDKIKRRPVKFNEEFFSVYLMAQPFEFRDESFSMPTVEGLSPYYTHEYNITRRDMDTNGHANNTVFVDWAIDFIPEETCRDKEIKDIKVAYKKEALCGDYITASYFVRDNEFIVVFVNKKDPATVLGQVSTLWE